jgi:hypothetical protein
MHRDHSDRMRAAARIVVPILIAAALFFVIWLVTL